MDNARTGAFIKELRRECGMTQKELACRLHITDRAVSKWERGLCAPDIALLEPLARELGVSVVELLEGQRTLPGPDGAETEARVRQVLGYSQEEIRRKVKDIGLRRIAAAAGVIAAAAAVCIFLLWQHGVFSLIDRCVSPDGRTSVSIYDRALDGDGFSGEKAVSLIAERDDGSQRRTVYGGCIYNGLWWAPDSRKYVLALEDEDGPRLILAWLDRNSTSNLSAYLTMGVETTELAKYGYADTSVWPEIEYRFLQWSENSEAMLIYYAFEDREGQLHNGYFWYHCLTGRADAVLEMDMPAGG